MRWRRSGYYSAAGRRRYTVLFINAPSQSESVVSGEVGSLRPPIMRPGIAPGWAATAGDASCTRQAIRVSRQWRGWQLAPADYATRDSARAGRGRWGCQLQTAGHPSQSSVARLAARARQLCDPG